MATSLQTTRLRETGYARVLIVDDEPMSVRLLSAQLKSTGWVTQEARGGEEAIRLARENQPDVILMDVMMPGVSGYEATKCLKGDPKTTHIPIILITGLRDVQDRLNGLEAGADEFLSKPVDSTELIVRINNLLKLRHYEEQLKNIAISHGFEQGKEETSDCSREPARILIFGDIDGESNGFQSHLEKQGYQIARSAKDVDRILSKSQPVADLIILDDRLNGVDTFEICQRMKNAEATKRLPLVVVTGIDDPDRRIRYLFLGADEMLVRPVDLRELAVRVERLVKQKLHLDSLQALYQSALIDSNNDRLTGLFNRAYFQRFLDLEIKRSLRNNHLTSLVILDLDDFKSKNDTFGHVTGDLILREVGKRIRSRIREIDMPARYGGEEFAIVLPYTDGVGALVVAERVRAGLASEPFLLGTPVSEIRVTASIGVATCPENGKISTELIQAADKMMYRSKSDGKNRVRRMISESK
jgi:two-component system cell cycle response regulator